MSEPSSGKTFAKNAARTLTRRHVLRGAGVALALPWLESLAPRAARGQAVAPPIRFLPVYFPMGTASFWTPKGTGGGDAWQLSPILEPLAALKSQVTVLGHVSNTAYGAPTVDPAYPRDSGSFLTCAAAQGTPVQNGTSVDQVIFQGLRQRGSGLPSAQLGLSTLDSYASELPPALSRSISWSSPTTPLFKMTSPQAVFDLLLGIDPKAPPVTDPATLERLATQKSVLDFVMADATALQPRLSYTDRQRVDMFLTSVRDLEQRMQPPISPVPGCATVARPTQAYGAGNVPPDYNRQTHATLMVDLMVAALMCDRTRVISLMLDDARSDFVYNFLTERFFTDAGSTPGTAPVGGYHGLASGTGLTNNGYATINRWFVSVLADLCAKLAAIPEANGRTVLDNSVVWFGSGMNNGQQRLFLDLPVLYVGSGGGVLKQGAHLDFASDRRLSDVYLTFIQKVFGQADVASFGDSGGIVTEILA